MLHVLIRKRTDNYRWDTDGDFWSFSKVKWINDERVIKIIETIDRNEVRILEPYNPDKPDYANYVIISPVFGYITPNEMSTGCKTLILAIMRPERMYSTLRMGENVDELMEELAKDMDITICAETSYPFKGKVHILNDDSYTNSSREYFSKYLKFDGEALDEEGAYDED